MLRLATCLKYMILHYSYMRSVGPYYWCFLRPTVCRDAAGKAF